MNTWTADFRKHRQIISPVCRKLHTVRTKKIWNRLTTFKQYLSVIRDGSFFFKRTFQYENDDEKTKNETIVFKKLVVSLTIVNEERRREETNLKGIGTHH